MSEWHKTEEATIRLSWMTLRVHRAQFSVGWFLSSEPALWSMFELRTKPGASIDEAKALALQLVAAATLSLSDAIDRAGVPMPSGHVSYSIAKDER